MSRAMVKVFRDYSVKNPYIASKAEDIQASLVLEELGKNMRNCTSPFFLGQYLHPKDVDIMEKMVFGRLKICPSIENITDVGCRKFLARYNRLVGLHRLSRRNFSTPVIRVWNYPDNIYWYMKGEHPKFCVYNSNENVIEE
jgi:hypothetical protein